MHLITSVDRSLFEVAAVSLYARQQTDIEQKLDEEGIRVAYLDKKPGMDLQIIPRIRASMRGFDPNIIHTHRSVLRYVLPAFWLQQRREIIHTAHNIAGKEVDAVGQVIQKIAFRTGVVSPVSIAEEVSASLKKLY